MYLKNLNAKFAAKNVKTAMLFVPSINGISHNPQEDTKITSIAEAVRLALAYFEKNYQATGERLFTPRQKDFVRPFPGQSIEKEKVDDEMEKHDVLAFDEIDPFSLEVVIAVRTLKSLGFEEMSEHLQWMAEEGLLREGPINDFLATIEERQPEDSVTDQESSTQEIAVISNSYEQFNTLKERMLSLVYIMGVVKRFSFTELANINREINARVMNQDLLGEPKTKRKEKRLLNPKERKEESKKAIEEVWANISKMIKSVDPEVESNEGTFLYKLYFALKRTLEGFLEKAERGEVDPFARIRTMKYGKDIADSRLHDLDREIQIGFMATAANPLNWGHLVSTLMSIDILGLDLGVIRVQGEIGYKDLLEEDLVPIDARHEIVQLVLKELFPLLRYTDLGSELHNDLLGLHEIYRFLNLNKDKKIHAVFLLGIEDEERVEYYLRLFYQLLRENGKLSEKHRITLGWIQRGEYGETITLEELNVINERIRKQKQVSEALPVVLIKDEDLDLNVSSTDYRNIHDASLVPFPVHENAVENCFYGHKERDLTRTADGKELTPGQKNLLAISLIGFSKKITDAESIDVEGLDLIIDKLQELGFSSAAEILKDEIIIRGPPELFKDFEKQTGRILLGINTSGKIIINPAIESNYRELILTLVHEAVAMTGHLHSRSLEVETIFAEKAINLLGDISIKNGSAQSKHVQENAKAIGEIWSKVSGTIKDVDPDVESKVEPFLSRLYAVLKRTFEGLTLQAKIGATESFAKIRTMKYGEEIEDSRFVDLDREVSVGFLAVAGNPLNWGHLLAAYMPLKILGLDVGVMRVQGEIAYKKLLASERVSVKDRHGVVKSILKDLFPLLRYTDLGSEPNNEREGFEDFIRFLELNADRRMHGVYLLGVENEERVENYTRQFYKMMKRYKGRISDKHRITIGWVQRGEYGKRITNEDLDATNERIRKEEGSREKIKMKLIKEEGIDLNVSSTYYRTTQDGAFVPRQVHEHAKKNGYYGHPPIDPRTREPVTESQEEYFRMQLQPVATTIAKQVRQAIEQGVTGDMPLISLDGGSGSGKSTIAEEVAKILAADGIDTKIIPLDMFLKDRIWRLAVQKGNRRSLGEY